MYVCYLVIIFLGKGPGLSFKKIWIPFTQGCFVLSLIEIGQWFCRRIWRRRLFNFIIILLPFSYYLPLEKGGALQWTNLNPLHPRMLCAKLGEIGSVVLEKILSLYFHYFVMISPWKRALPFIWTKNLNPLHLRMLCAKLGWNWPTDPQEIHPGLRHR